MPKKDDISWIQQKNLLSFNEIFKITTNLVSLGIEKVRITGGEPLQRDNIEILIRMLRSINGLKSIDMTTNGFFLSEKCKDLAEAGLDGVTISIHSLRQERFAKISGFDALPKVLESISKSYKAGFKHVKLNSVLIRGYNDDEIIDLVEFARKMNIIIKFIEFMPLDGLGIWNYNNVIKGKEIIDIVSRYYNIIPEGRKTGDTTSFWRFDDGKGKLGVITPMSAPFCDDCDRIRITADGKLVTCLFDTNYYDLKPYLNNDMNNINNNSNGFIKKDMVNDNSNGNGNLQLSEYIAK
jgi:cyclic pyranopterin phosphate synthase